MELLRELWPLGAALLTGLMGWVASQARTLHRLQSMEQRVKEAEEDIEALQNSRSADAVTLGVLEVTLRQIKDMLGDMRNEMREGLRSKADKPDR